MKYLKLLVLLTPLFIGESLCAAWADIEDYFDDYSSSLGSGWYRTWIGDIYPDPGSNLWFYHLQHGWLLIDGGDPDASPESIIVWEAAMNWAWYSESDDYPYIRRAGGDWRYYYYYESTTDPREYWDYTDQIMKIDLTQDVPAYVPIYWNDGYPDGAIEPHNNCYNYGTNCETGTYAQPGRAAGGSCDDWYYTPPYDSDCAAIGNGVTSSCDGSMVPGDENGPVPVGKSRAALFHMYNGEDYHFYRQDSDGHWSHKPGFLPATNKDYSGNLIQNVQNADRRVKYGSTIFNYSVFCGYYYVVNSSNLQGQTFVNIN